MAGQRGGLWTLVPGGDKSGQLAARLEAVLAFNPEELDPEPFDPEELDPEEFGPPSDLPEDCFAGASLPVGSADSFEAESFEPLESELARLSVR